MTSSGVSKPRNAPKIAPAIFWQVMLRALTAAGKRGLTIEPSGAVMRTASNIPLFGSSPGSSNALTGIEHGRLEAAFRHVEGALRLRRRTGEVKVKLPALDMHCHRQRRLLVAAAIIVQIRREGVRSGLQLRDAIAQALRGVGKNVVDRTRHRLYTGLSHQFEHTPGAEIVGGDLRHQIEAALLRLAGVLGDQPQQAAVELASRGVPMPDARRRNTDALLEDA